MTRQKVDNLLSVASDPGNIVGTDRYSNVWSTRPLPDGRQVWVQIRRNRITNGGVNATPRFFDFGYGLTSALASGGLG
jgi:hypothetical protein